MKCPYCGEDSDRVLDSRASQEGFAIRRRRECLGCKRRYTTYERLEDLQIRVVKKDGCREPFDSDKIRRGLEKACWKRPVSMAAVEQIVSGLVADLYESLEPEVESREIGERVMRELREIDQVAFVRFASVYREFTDVADFVDELQPMLKERRAAKRAPASKSKQGRDGARREDANARDTAGEAAADAG